MMNIRIILVLTLLSLAIYGCIAYCAEEPATAPAEADAQSINYREVPPTLATQINERLSDITKRYQLSEADNNQIRESVMGLDYRTTPPAENKTNRNKLRQFGVAALPVLSTLLESQDENTRLKVMSAMKQLLFPELLKEGAKSGDNQAASLQVALLRRAMCDKSIKVRRIALIELKYVAFRQPGTDAEEAKAGITEACSDPDPEIRALAEDYYKHFTEVKEE